MNKDRTSGDYIICACLLILMLQVEGLLMAGDSAPQYVTPLATPRKNGNGKKFKISSRIIFFLNESNVLLKEGGFRNVFIPIALSVQLSLQSTCNLTFVDR